MRNDILQLHLLLSTPSSSLDPLSSLTKTRPRQRMNKHTATTMPASPIPHTGTRQTPPPLRRVPPTFFPDLVSSASDSSCSSSQVFTCFDTTHHHFITSEARSIRRRGILLVKFVNLTADLKISPKSEPRSDYFAAAHSHMTFLRQFARDRTGSAGPNKNIVCTSNEVCLPFRNDRHPHTR